MYCVNDGRNLRNAQPVGETFVCTRVQRHDPAVTLEMFPSAKSTNLKKREQTNIAVPFPFSLVLNAPAQLSLAPSVSCRYFIGSQLLLNQEHIFV